MAWQQKPPKDDTLREISLGLAIVGFLVLVFGDWGTGAQYIGGGFVILAVIVNVINRLIDMKERGQ